MADPVQIYRYPLSSFTDKTDYLQISVVNYKPVGKRGTVDEENPTTLTGTSLTGSPGSRRNTGKQLEKVIFLPIPSNISDSNGSKFGGSNLNSIAGAAAAGVINTMGTGSEYIENGKFNIGAGLLKTFEAASIGANATATAAGGAAELQGFATRFLASKALGIANINLSPDQILARTEGRILNPNMELLFEGPTLRTFRFAFKFTPRNDKEAIQIKQIIRCFKENSAPKVGGSGTFLKTPKVFELTYMQGANPHEFLNKFKQCFLETVSVNYTADGVYATYDDGTPVSMVMNLTFREIEPIYDIDYGTGPISDGNQYSPTPGGVGY